MNKSYFFLIIGVSLMSLIRPTFMFAQQETFDIATFTPPKGWNRQVSQDAIQFTKEDAAKGAYCAITLFRSLPGIGDSRNNFDAAWTAVVKEMVPASAAPTIQPAAADNGWEVQSGYAAFESDGAKGIVILVTSSGFEKMMNAMIITNTDVYEKNISDFLGSIRLKKPEPVIKQSSPGNNANSPVVGTWGIGTTTASYYNTNINEGSIIIQYTFKVDGTYSFYIKTFRYQLDKLLLTRETGTYQINGNTIIVVPQKSVIESWSKKNGTDDWGQLLSSQKKELEKTTYRFFTKDFGSGMVLVLQAGKETKRDGAFNNSDKDAWFYPSKSVAEYIKLPGGEQLAEEVNKGTVLQSTANTNTTIMGTWSKQGSVHETYGDPVSHGNAGYSKDQYTFNPNGTYSFVAKTFRSSFEKILLVKENGTYQINGTNLTVIPQKSVIEAWSKKDGTDKWGKLLTSQSRALEKVTYRFSMYYFTGIQQWNLVLQADKATQREGPFSNNTTFNNAWYFVPPSPNNTPIELPGEPEKMMKKTSVNVPPKSAGGFTFTTTNFDDGWVATEQADWVLVSKGVTRILIHYPNKRADEYNPDLLGGLKNAWDVLVAPKYNTVGNLLFRPVSGWQSLEFAEADAVEKNGKSVYVVLFKMNYSNGSGKFMEFITPDKQTFEQEFGAYHQSTSGWEKMESMANYNKFAIAASDLIGKWSSNFSGVTQYVNAITGLDAGMDTHASAENFQIGPGNSYKWDLAVASGPVGSIKFQGVKSIGIFSVPSNWTVNFSDIEGKPKTYDAFFSCIKGLRILWIDGKPFAKVE